MKNEEVPKVTFVISSVHGGGACRVMVTMANYWSDRGWHIQFKSLDSSAEPFYRISAGVDFQSLGMMAKSKGVLDGFIRNLRRMRDLRSVIREDKPDCVISFLTSTNILILFATRFLGVPVIVSERNNPHEFRGRLVWRLLRRIAYCWADRIVVQAERCRRLLRGRVAVIPNPVVAQRQGTSAGARERKKYVLAAGRLHRQKGFDILLRAFARLKEDLADWQIVVLGEGDERNELERLRDGLGLRERVEFVGHVKDVSEWMSKSSLFVLSSRYEGFPNVLCEAMANGLPVIAFDCLTGPREIIRDGVDGILVPPEDEEALTNAMDQLLSSPAKRLALAQKAPDVIKRFEIEHVMKMWANLIRAVIQERQGQGQYIG